jgi:transcriptional regulator GlxA family with amidase domain
MEKLNVGILLFDDVEVLDFAGPFEVFSRTRLIPEDSAFKFSRVVQDGISSSAGVSAGIDMAFALVEEICGPSVAEETCSSLTKTK